MIGRVSGSPDDTKLGNQDGMWEKQEELVNGRPAWQQEKFGNLAGIFYGLSYDASKEVWTLNDGTPTGQYSTHIFVSNEKNLPSPFGDNVSWKYVKSSNNGPLPLFADTPAPSVSFTCEEYGPAPTAEPTAAPEAKGVCMIGRVSGSPDDTKLGNQDGMWEKQEELVNGRPAWQQEKFGNLAGIFYGLSYDASKEVWTLNDGTPTGQYSTHIFVSNEKNLPSPFGDNVSWKYVKSSNNGPLPLFADTPAPSVSFTCEEYGPAPTAVPTAAPEAKEAIKVTSGLCEAREMSRDECEAYANRISRTFHERSFSIYPGGCLVGPRGDVYYNTRQHSNAKCGDHGVACVCNKHEDRDRFPATTSAPKDIPCPDKLPDNKCALYAANHACTTHKPYMSINCRTTCQIGGCVNRECKDYHKDCASFAQNNYCNTGRIYMQYMCANSCNLCRK